LQPAEGRQQRRVDVQQPAGVARDELGRQDAHEAGQHHQVGLVPVDLLGQRGVEGGAIGMRAVVQTDRGDALRLRPGQPARLRTVADDGNDGGGPALGLAGLLDGFHVGAPAGNQDHDAFHGCGSVIGARQRTRPLVA